MRSVTGRKRLPLPAQRRMALTRGPDRAAGSQRGSGTNTMFAGSDGSSLRRRR